MGGGKSLYIKTFRDFTLKVDFKDEKLLYPEAIIINDKTTSNFSKPENFVVFECVHRLLEKGYNPDSIELEPKWQLGRESKSGKADILVKDNEGKSYLLIECKTTDSKNSEFKKEWNNMLNDGGQLISYFQQDKNVKFLCLYTSDLRDQKLLYENYILNMQDNDVYLKESGFKESYKNANTAEEIYKVWNEIYKLDYSQIGIFERNINAYEVGKNTLCFDDLKELSSLKDDTFTHEDGKYHEFAKILRKYNISGKENAFDKLVNLFLCKIYDESYNKDNLNFVYRGVVADTFWAMQDRLMLLYKNAMKEFLKEDITFVADSDIENAFKGKARTKKAMNALENEIKNFIKVLKFYSNNDFAFLEVHNEKLFYQNALVLVSVVKLFENLKLTQNKTNQFLGNLFELFLQKGMKQDEGQFFTPIQICEFIIYSLPIEQMLGEKIPKVLDFACGAGHFLNTYANFIKDSKNLKADLKEYYQNITGIEKEYRLSKVAKVSACMYGQNEINIIYSDALDFDALDLHSFDILIANPPYSVQGFLETLSDKSRQSYTLFSKNINLESNNNIECFFIERANQLLGQNAVAGIILPSSLLNKGGIYEKTRELILQNFEIIAIVELGSQTFGATGTNTIILFLQKRPTYESDKLHSQRYNDLKDRLKSANLKDNDDFVENGIVDSYCAFAGYEVSDFLALLDSSTLNESLANHTHFVEYKQEFQKNEFEKLKNTKAYKDTRDKESFANAELIKFIQHIEKEKLLFYALAYKNEVLIIKSPSDNKEQKRFLGYEWSNRKGSEGLKELNTPYLTPLFERGNRDNKEKLSYLIKQAFICHSKSELESFKMGEAQKSVLGVGERAMREGEGDASQLEPLPTSHDENLDKDTLQTLGMTDSYLSKAIAKESLITPLYITKELATYAKVARLIDMLDFSRVDFTKAISLNPKAQRQEILSKYPLIKLETCGDFFMGGTPSRKIPNYWNGDIKWLTISDYANFDLITQTSEKITNEGFKNSNVKLIPKGAVVVSIYATIGRVGILGEDMATNQAIVSIVPNKDFINKYLMYVIDFYNFQLFDEVITTSQKNVNLNILQNMVIPKPPLEIQQKIINKCEEVEEQYKILRMSKEEYQKLIKAILQKCGIIATNLEASLLDSIILNLKELEDKILESFKDMFSHSKPSFSRHSEPLGKESFTSPSLTEGARGWVNPLDKESKNMESNLDSKDTSDLKALSMTNNRHFNQSEESFNLGEIQSLINTLPTPPKNGWEMRKMAQIAKNIFAGGDKPKAFSESKTEKYNIPIYANATQNKGLYGYTDKAVVFDNALSVSARGSIGYAVARFEPFVPIVRLIVLIPKDDIANLNFLELTINHMNIVNSGSNIPQLTVPEFSSFQIPLPPLKEQEKIIHTIEKIESKINLVDEKIKVLESKKEEILNSALKA